MTNQQAFNKIWNHFIVNKGKKSSEGSYCKYRDGAGNKCAVGVLIPDNLYDKNLEGKGYAVLISEHESMKVFFKDINIQLLLDLQCTHDDAGYWDKGILDKERLIEIAEEYELKIPTT